MNAIRPFLPLFFYLFAFQINAQEAERFKLYYAPDKYTNEVRNMLKSQANFNAYRLMLGWHIDPKNKGVVDKESFIKNIIKFYPNLSSNDILCIDLENKVYRDLADYDAGTAGYQKASSAFVWMLKTVKKMRPNVKVGIYGLPFRAYYPNAKNTNKLDVILSCADYIFPSLYTMYPDSQIGKLRNEKYLKENLSIALEYGIRLKKPVIPFVWSVVHPSNTLSGGQLLSSNEVVQNLKLIENFSYKNTKVKGVVWWDPDANYFSKVVKTQMKSTNNDPKYLQSKILQDYLHSYLNAN